MKQLMTTETTGMHEHVTHTRVVEWLKEPKPLWCEVESAGEPRNSVKIPMGGSIFDVKGLAAVGFESIVKLEIYRQGYWYVIWIHISDP